MVATERTPGQTARLVGLVTVGGLLVALTVFLVITQVTGDPTDDLENRQPTPSPSATP